MIVPIPLRLVSEANARDHWAKRARRTKGTRNTVGQVVAGYLVRTPVSLPCVVTITRIAPSGGLDDDNMVSSAKAARDGIADALGVDDADPRVSWSYAQRRGKRGEWAIEVRIEAADGLHPSRASAGLYPHRSGA